jgi:hypothetical protein
MKIDRDKELVSMAVRLGRGHDRPAGEVDRAYALDRSFGPKGFWDWSRRATTVQNR